MNDQSEPSTPTTVPGSRTDHAGKSSQTGRQTYNMVSDTVVGVNFRLSDNLVQLIAAVVGAVIGAIVGLFIVDEPIAGLIVGGIIGMVAGVFATGIGLMIYRGVRHIKGKHD